jgi:predicted nucleic-acid-binding Zn-ribbon protein
MNQIRIWADISAKYFYVIFCKNMVLHEIYRGKLEVTKNYVQLYVQGKGYGV